VGKVENYRELADYGATRTQVRTVLNRWNPDTVADDSTVGRLRLESMPGVMYLPEMPSQFLIFEGPRYWLKATSSRRVAMAVDKRLLWMNHRYNLRESAANAGWRGDWQLLDTAETPGALLYLFGLPERQTLADTGKQPVESRRDSDCESGLLFFSSDPSDAGSKTQRRWGSPSNAFRLNSPKG
jgi:hypothetical protein